MTPRVAVLFVGLTLALTLGCRERSAPAAPSTKKKGTAKKPSDRIAIPSAVRKNLGITFARVERRDVRATLRVPGRFEVDPAARQHYHAAFSGRVRLLVKQYQVVTAGTPLYRISSPQWRELQGRLASAGEAIRLALQRRSGLAERYRVTGLHQHQLNHQAQIWQKRVAQIEKLIEAGSGAAKDLAEARSQLAAVRTSLAEVTEERAEVKMKQATCESSISGFKQRMPLLYAEATGTRPSPGASKLDLALGKAAALLDIPVEELRRNVGTKDRPVPYWRTINEIVVRARMGGVVERIAEASGAWVDASGQVLTTVDRLKLRFRAVGLQSDLARLENGLPVRIVPPRGGAKRLIGQIPAKLQIGLEANADQRTIDLLAQVTLEQRLRWARPGVAAEMEITVAGGRGPQNAIPLSAVMRDGLARVFFRRDPRDPNQVFRVDADLGVDDGRWVVVESGVKAGDQVVLHGAYELMLASSGGARKGGHFHPDGTFHEGEH